MGALRTRRESWIEAGLAVLAEQGVDAIKVEALARTLGVTKGGFYGYFADRAALLAELLDAWERTAVDEVLDHIEGVDLDPVERARLAGQLTFSGDLLAIDLAVRAWARRDAEVAGRLRAVDNRRMDLVREAISSICDDPDEVEARALLAFCMAIANSLVAADHPGRTRDQVAIRASALLLGRPTVPHG